jgi:hypothetical protein
MRKPKALSAAWIPTTAAAAAAAAVEISADETARVFVDTFGPL